MKAGATQVVGLPVTLLEACANGWHEAAKLALAAEEDPNHPWPGGISVMHVAASRGDVVMVRLLLAHEARVDPVTVHGETPLYFASGEGHLAVAKELIRAGARVGATTLRAATPLHAAMAARKFDLATMLLWAGADPGVRNDLGMTPFELVSQEDIPVALLELSRARARRKPRAADPTGI
jgi:ankyrin repeat protein